MSRPADSWPQLGAVLARVLALPPPAWVSEDTLAGLARLASVTSGRVRQLVTAGEIAAMAGSAREPSQVTAVEARRWLSARGLKGW